MARQKSHSLRVYNSSKQLICLQLRAPGSDFFSNEQQVRLKPGQDAELPKSHVRMEQINNLKVRGAIKVLFDSEVEQEREEALNS